MEEVLKNASSFIDVLGMSRSSMIRQWDAEALHRSFKWAAYFEQVHQKIAKKERLKLQLSQKLEQECFKANSALGIYCLKFEDLKQAKRILTRNILQNVWCPLEIYTETINISCKASNETQLSENPLDDFKEIFKLQSLAATLTSIGTSLTGDSDSRPTENSRPSFAEETQKLQKKAENNLCVFKDSSCCFSLNVHCRLFRTYVTKSLRHNSSKDEIWRKLEPLALSEDGQLVIVHSVSDLRDEENADCEDEHDLETFKSFVMEFIAMNLVSKWKSNPRSFLQLPADVLVDLALTKDFLLPYIDVLLQCCEWYDQESQGDDMVLIQRLRDNTSTAATEDRSLAKITSHFHELKQRRELDRSIMYRYRDRYNAKNKPSIQLLLESTFNKLVNRYFPYHVSVS